MKSQLRELVTLNEIGIILNQALQFDDTLKPVLEKLVNLTGLSSGWIFLSNVALGNKQQGSFRLAAHTGLPPALSNDNQNALCKGGCECQGMLSQGNLDQGVNMVTCSRLSNTRHDKQGLEIHASIPLLTKDGPVGIINLGAAGDTSFDEQSLTFLTAVGRQMGTAYDRSSLLETQTQEARYLATLEERQRLAMDMHDSVAQLLFAADLQAQVGQEQSQLTHKDEALAKTSVLVQEAQEELRSLIELNRPAELSIGLGAALCHLAKRMNTRLKITLDLSQTQLDTAVEEVFYRITQEALHNVLKHARATEVWIELKQEANQVSLSIKDNGTGFDAKKSSHGLGLSSMRKRAESIAARFLVSTKNGTLIKVSL